MGVCRGGDAVDGTNVFFGGANLGFRRRIGGGEEGSGRIIGRGVRGGGALKTKKKAKAVVKIVFSTFYTRK